MPRVSTHIPTHNQHSHRSDGRVRTADLWGPVITDYRNLPVGDIWHSFHSLVFLLVRTDPILCLTIGNLARTTALCDRSLIGPVLAQIGPHHVFFTLVCLVGVIAYTVYRCCLPQCTLGQGPGCINQKCHCITSAIGALVVIIAFFGVLDCAPLCINGWAPKNPYMSCASCEHHCFLTPRHACYVQSSGVLIA